MVRAKAEKRACFTFTGLMGSFKKKQPDGLQRFRIQLEDLRSLVKGADKEKKNGPGQYFFEAGTRTVFFKLQALARIYRSILDKKIFDSLYRDFKQLEDQLGKIDEYDFFLKDLSKENNLPELFLNYFKTGKENQIKTLDEMIINGNLLSGEDKIDQLLKSLEKVKWLEHEEERKMTAHFLAAEIYKIITQYADGNLSFNDIELGLHELRRKVRWISIYAQALNGLISLKPSMMMPAELQPYMTPEVVNSSFNRLPAVPEGINPITIQEPFFHALSWFINELGKLKDKGLWVIAVHDAIRKQGIKSSEGLRITTQLISPDSLSIAGTLEKAERITDRFIYDNRVLYTIRRDMLRSLN